MKTERVSWWLSACSICLLVLGAAIWVNQDLKRSGNKETTVKSIRLVRERFKKGADWLRYRELQKKLSKLNQGWIRPIPNAGPGSEPALPIAEAVDQQIAEIRRIHDEEVLGKLSNSNRIFREHQQKLRRGFEEKLKLKSSIARAALEADLAVKKQQLNRALEDFRRDLEKKQQLTLVNLELELKMADFNPGDPEKQKSEKERIKTELDRIRKEIKKEVDIRADELEKEYKSYQKRRTADFQAEISRYRQRMLEEMELEIIRFREQQTKEFEVWYEQRQSEVNQAIELRRSQK